MPRTRREWKIFPINIRELEVARILDLSPGMRRVTLTGSQLGGFTTRDGIAVPALRTEGFDDHVKIIVPAAGETSATPPRQVEGHLDWSGSSPGKDYTPRRWDAAGGELDLDFVRHGTGLASTWVESAVVGDRLHIAGPKNSVLMPAGFDWLLVGGDETALPAIARMLEEWPAGVRGQVFVEVADPDHRITVVEPGGVEVNWLYRNGIPAGHSTLLAESVRGAPWWPGSVYCWLAGEAISLKPIRSYLKVDRQVPADCWEVTGYWRRSEVIADASGRTVQEHSETADFDAKLAPLTNLIGPVALRAAITVGLFERLEKGWAAPSVVAFELAVAEPLLRALLRYLASIDLITPAADDPAVVGDGPVGLTSLSQHLITEYDHFTDPAGFFLDFSAEQLAAALRTGRPMMRIDGRSAAAVFTDPDDPSGTAARAHLTFDSGWAMPAVVQHHDWSGHSAALLQGPGATALAAQLHADIPALPVTLAGTPTAGGIVVLIRALEQLNDGQAVDLLASVRSAAAAVGAQVLLVELVRDTDEAVHDHDAELDLQLHVWFGSGLRSAAEIEDLLIRTGFDSAPGGGLGVGWDLRQWDLTIR